MRSQKDSAKVKPHTQFLGIYVLSHLAKDQSKLMILIIEFNRRKYNEDKIFAYSQNISTKDVYLLTKEKSG